MVYFKLIWDLYSTGYLKKTGIISLFYPYTIKKKKSIIDATKLRVFNKGYRRGERGPFSLKKRSGPSTVQDRPRLHVDCELRSWDRGMCALSPPGSFPRRLSPLEALVPSFQRVLVSVFIWLIDKIFPKVGLCIKNMKVAGQAIEDRTQRSTGFGHRRNWMVLHHRKAMSC